MSVWKEGRNAIEATHGGFLDQHLFAGWMPAEQISQSLTDLETL